jgi:hypothetical protein
MSKLKGLLTFVFMAAGLAVLAPGALASGSPQGPPAGPTTPPFTQCPPIGQDTTCQYLIDVKSATEPPVIIEDPSQIYYDGNDDVTVVVQNETGAPLSKVHIGVLDSGDGIFGFDGDGICSETIVPKPSGCPFSTELNEAAGYTGPDTVLQEESESLASAGTVTFPTPLANDQYTYFTLEAPPYGTTLVAGEVNDTIATKLSPAPQTEPPVEEARLTFLTPVNVTDKATLRGPNAKFAEGEVEYRVYSDPGCTKEVANAGKAKLVPSATEEDAAEAEASQPVGASLPTNATYYWQVKYTGSKKGVKAEENSPATSVCGAEAMAFGVASVVTTLSGGGQIGTALTVAPNTPVTDTATVSGGGQSVYGQIEYKVYSNASCTTEVANGGTVTTLNGIGPSSQPVTLSTPGTYYFQASFTGEKVHLTGKSPCGSEVVNVVAPPPPAASAQQRLHDSGHRGGLERDGLDHFCPAPVGHRDAGGDGADRVDRQHLSRGRQGEEVQERPGQDQGQVPSDHNRGGNDLRQWDRGGAAEAHGQPLRQDQGAAEERQDGPSGRDPDIQVIARRNPDREHLQHHDQGQAVAPPPQVAR